MKIEVGNPLMGKATCEIEGDEVSFIAEDGRCMFRVHVGKNGRSLEIRGINPCKVGGVLYDSSLLVSPNASNSITISTPEYDKR